MTGAVLYRTIRTMPAAVAARQFEHPAEAWLSGDGVLALFGEELRQSGAEIARGFGHFGLHLRPCARAPGELPNASVRTVLSMFRRGAGLAGDMHCEDAALPVAAASLSIVCVQHVLESSPDPAALVEQLARALKPEGLALFLVLNPRGLMRLRWLRQEIRAIPARQLMAWVRGAGLEVVACRYVGTFWRTPGAVQGERAGAFAARLRSSYLLVARRRDMGMTPLPAQRAGVALKPGISAG